MKHFSLALTFLSVIALWIGLISLGRKAKGKAWHCMVIGAVLYSAAIFLTIWWYIEQSLSPITWIGADQDLRFRLHSIGLAIRSTNTYGLIVFFIGFALYHTRSAKLQQRISELEMMNLAQATELERLRNR